MSSPGERGPKGDHGQHGDEGAAGLQGDIGVPGAPGAPGTPGAAGASGAVGERGREGLEGEAGAEGKKGRAGRNAPSNWVAYIIMALTLILAAIVFVREQDDDQKARDAVARQRVIDSARSTLSNCLEIETVVKAEIRKTVQASLARIPTLAYYKEHPGERRQAVKDAKASIERFKSRNCYELPTVKRAGLKPPPP